MNNIHWICKGLAIALLLSAPAVSAFNLRWLENSPAESFTDEDWRLLRETVTRALDSGERGQRLTWENPDTGHSGSVSHMGPADYDGHTCVRLGIYNETERLAGSSIARFCRQADGSWKMDGR